MVQLVLSTIGGLTASHVLRWALTQEDALSCGDHWFMRQQANDCAVEVVL